MKYSIYLEIQLHIQIYILDMLRLTFHLLKYTYTARS